MSASIILGKSSLTLQDVKQVSMGKVKVKLSDTAKKRIEESYQYLQSRLKKDETIYGVNTGFGVLSNVKVEKKDLEKLQLNLLRSHACGVGAYLSDEEVRVMLLLRANALAQGHSGVSVALVEQILEVLNRGIIPLIPEQGSVGASGDLAPLSHLALVLVGEGKARLKGKVMSGGSALRACKLKPIKLQAKEGLALINGTQLILAIGALTYLRAEKCSAAADLAGALTLEAVRGTDSAFEPEIHQVRPHPGQILVAQNLRNWLIDSKTKKSSEISSSHENCGKVQDPYSLRCMPQVHGATRDVLAFVKGVLERELNSVTDNPLVFVSSKKILSGGNFHGEILAMALDFLAIAVSELGNISEQRLQKMINPILSDLPAFLVKKGGLNSGFMIVQVAAASLVSENKGLCHPASVDSIPTSADKEDHVSMGPWAARKAKMVVNNVQKVLAMELLAAAQGIDLLRPLRTTSQLESQHRQIRKISKRLDDDRSLHEDIENMAQWIEESMSYEN